MSICLSFSWPNLGLSYESWVQDTEHMGPKLGKVSGNEIILTQNDVLRDPREEKSPWCVWFLSNEKWYGIPSNAFWHISSYHYWFLLAVLLSLEIKISHEIIVSLHYEITSDTKPQEWSLEICIFRKLPEMFWEGAQKNPGPSLPTPPGAISSIRIRPKVKYAVTLSSQEGGTGLGLCSIISQGFFNTVGKTKGLVTWEQTWIKNHAPCIWVKVATSLSHVETQHTGRSTSVGLSSAGLRKFTDLETPGKEVQWWI